MGTIMTSAAVTVDPAADRAPVAIFTLHECAYCRSPIASGQRWVREKIFGSTGNYRRYHADLFGDEELSCWEKHQIELEVRLNPHLSCVDADRYSARL